VPVSDHSRGSPRLKGRSQGCSGGELLLTSGSLGSRRNERKLGKEKLKALPWKFSPVSYNHGGEDTLEKKNVK